MWISINDKTKTPVIGQRYLITAITDAEPKVKEAMYTEDGEWEDGSLMFNPSRIVGWWSEPIPEPMRVKKNPPYLIFPPYELGSNGNNKKLSVSILSDEEMLGAGFLKCKDIWHFSKDVSGKNYIFLGISVKRDDPSDFAIRTVQLSGKPFEYQNILSEESYFTNELAVRVYEKVEQWMEYLSEKGILHGHTKGEYI